MPQVCIYDNTIIGDHVTIHAGTVIGSDGFYFKKRATHFEKLHSAGGVIIEDEVDIGAQCSIDKGVTAYTRIGKGTKIDNQVQIRSEEHTSELQSRGHLVCRLLLA